MVTELNALVASVAIFNTVDLISKCLTHESDLKASAYDACPTMCLCHTFASHAGCVETRCAESNPELGEFPFSFAPVSYSVHPGYRAKVYPFSQRLCVFPNQAPCNSNVLTLGIVDWRQVPLLTALSYGVNSVEADVWLVNGTLYVCTGLLAVGMVFC